jgi:radical SAM protein with 4Fe4S-binding SPASM domain
MGIVVNKKKHFTIINQMGRRILKDMLPLAKPLSIFIEPTNRCNFKCVCCGHGNEKNRNDLKPLMHMNPALFYKVVDELRDWEGPKLSLLRLAVLGEPFMHPQMLEMINAAKKADVAERVDLFSNGSLLTEKISSGLVESGLDGIRFSIYSVLPEKHRQVTQTGFDIQVIRRNIARLREIRERRGCAKPSICVKMFDTYGEENEIFIAMYKDIADEVDFENVNDATLYNGTNLIKAFYNDETLEERVRTNFCKSLHGHIACPRPFMAMVISSNGAVLMCTHDYPRATKIGDANKQTLREIWNSRALFEFRKMHLSGRKHENLLCRNCNWYKLFPDEDNVDGFPVERFMPTGK